MSDTGFEGKEVRDESGTIYLDGEIGSGREGHVFRVRNSPSWAVKVFNPEYRVSKESKVRAMVKEDNKPKDPTYQQENIRSIAWPEEIIEDSTTGEFIGYKMPRIDTNKAENALVYAMTELKWSNSLESERLLTALNLTLMVGELHQHGHAIGDFNHENILVNEAIITFIDCDAFHINGERDSYSGDTFLPRYAPPEKRPDNLEAVQMADRFCLAVHIFQFLLEGHHPFLAKGPNSATGDFRNMIKNNPFPFEDSDADIKPHKEVKQRYDKLSPEIKEKFNRCFTHGKHNKIRRPTAEDWEDALKKVTNLSEKTDSEVSKNESQNSGIYDENVGSSPEPNFRESSGSSGSPDKNIKSRPGYIGQLLTFSRFIPGSYQRSGLNKTIQRLRTEIKHALLFLVVILLTFLVFYLILSST